MADGWRSGAAITTTYEKYLLVLITKYGFPLVAGMRNGCVFLLIPAFVGHLPGYLRLVYRYT